jgi:aminoglycoside phosphotransferase (APT) family kinase protein
MPAADVVVTADLVRRLLADQHPDLANQRVEFLANGWDNELFRVWDSALSAPRYAGPPVWLHGDLHPANILVTDGQVSGVIDFGIVYLAHSADNPQLLAVGFRTLDRVL